MQWVVVDKHLFILGRRRKNDFWPQIETYSQEKNACCRIITSLFSIYIILYRYTLPKPNTHQTLLAPLDMMSSI